MCAPSRDCLFQLNPLARAAGRRRSLTWSSGVNDHSGALPGRRLAKLPRSPVPGAPLSVVLLHAQLAGPVRTLLAARWQAEASIASTRIPSQLAHVWQAYDLHVHRAHSVS